MARSCRVGVHGRNDTDFHENDYQAIREAEIEAIKMMSQTRVAVFKRLKADNPKIETITRLYDGPTFGTHGHPTPEDFARRMIPTMRELRPYCTKFEVHNEPNHLDRIEGWGDTDEDAQDFNTWFLRVYDILKEYCPWAQLGFPGLAIPHRDIEWIEICAPAVEKSDWLGVHCYWQTPRGQERNHLVDAWGLRFKHYHKRFPHKIIDLTEVGNSNVQNNIPFTEESHASEFIQYLEECFKYPYLNSACWFILSSPDPTWDGFIWRGEDGRFHKVVEAVGELERPRLIPARGSQPAISFTPPAVTPTPPLETTVTTAGTSTFTPPPAPALSTPAAPSFSSPTTPASSQPATELSPQPKQITPSLVQLQQLLNQSQELQAELNKLQTENSELLAQLQQVQPQPTPGSTPAGDGVPPLNPPPVQNITQQLKRHPTLQYQSRPLNQINRIIIHHTAITPTVGAERIANHRVDSQGWPGIGYHYFITGSGQVQQTNELSTIAYHAGDQYNPVAIGIAFAGDFTNTAPPSVQIDAGAHLIAWLLQRLDLSLDAVYGYKELVVTQSPGNQWDSGARWGSQLRQKIQDYLAGIA